MTDTRRAHSFNAAAAQYAASRPSYPPALFDTVEELSGRPLRGAAVVDVGAGTGIASARLHARGARLLAVEPGEGMAAEFRRQLPGVPVVRGDGNALPLASGSADLLTFAQSWHWTDPARALPEALRVLRPGGTLALWWNVMDHRVDWVAAQGARLAAHFGAHAGAHGTPDRVRAEAGAAEFTHHRVPWSRRISIDTHLAHIGSHSLLLVAGEESRASFLTAERAALLRDFPDGTLDEPYVVDLLVTHRPRGN
ncbi:UbiE/COQ5 methyltransferase [Streptomyces albus]|uniref:UbiE/COQ5 methyltransferase n=1 Tax=Streptomyces albus (strain ATCC 21838 / DSM 41398 / FERM P-419 / JCM 4703 / NBRC 107858) TaxID=1081613 RepID=A0A0B5ENK9_STRA4|nr:UbiE/COQ5 methyltransferase [Streptomyces albus]AOU77517.1 UbiE/COQ5 methyltransferase [Streptomyces albus]AYN33288.1 class I SAM-dependent methyltransferase [Streptomyces albus]